MQGGTRAKRETRNTKFQIRNKTKNLKVQNSGSCVLDFGPLLIGICFEFRLARASTRASISVKARSLATTGLATTITWQFSARAASSFFQHATGESAVLGDQHADIELVQMAAVFFNRERPATCQHSLRRDSGSTADVERLRMVEARTIKGTLVRRDSST